MLASDLVTLSKASPFQPFTIMTAGGQRCRVADSELILVSPTRETAIVFQPDGQLTIVAVAAIESVSVEIKGTKRRKSAP